MPAATQPSMEGENDDSAAGGGPRSSFDLGALALSLARSFLPELFSPRTMSSGHFLPISAKKLFANRFGYYGEGGRRGRERKQQRRWIVQGGRKRRRRGRQVDGKVGGTVPGETTLPLPERMEEGGRRGSLLPFFNPRSNVGTSYFFVVSGARQKEASQPCIHAVVKAAAS